MMRRSAPIVALALAGCVAAEPLPAPPEVSFPPSPVVDADGPHRTRLPERLFVAPVHRAPEPEEDWLGEALARKRADERSGFALAVDRVAIGTAALLVAEAVGRPIHVDPEVAERPSAPFALTADDGMAALGALARANDLSLSINGDTPLTPGDDLSPEDVVYLTTHRRLIAAQETAKQAADNAVALMGKRREARGAVRAARGEEGNVTRSYRFRYADPQAALDYLASLYTDGAEETKEPDERKNPSPIRFALYPPENIVTVSAPAPVGDEIAARMASLDVRPRQVYIEARIVEIQRNYLKDLGIQWGGYGSVPTGRTFPHSIDVAGGATGNGVYPDAVNLPAESAIDPTTGLPLAAPRGGALGVTFGSISGAALLSARLTALEREGVSRTLSNPKVVAINGGTAVIKSGREIPYQSSSANLGVSVAFKEAVISLTVAPQILDDDRVRMKIVARKDEVDPALSVQGTPAIKKKEIATNVVVGNGGSAALGGVFEGVDTRREDKTPGLADIPIIGRLFRADHDDATELELLVFITPTILDEREERP
jgi:type II secretory pathway component GspD/PulD (secretin)